MSESSWLIRSGDRGKSGYFVSMTIVNDVVRRIARLDWRKNGFVSGAWLIRRPSGPLSSEVDRTRSASRKLQKGDLQYHVLSSALLFGCGSALAVLLAVGFHPLRA